jgi:type IV fimbrial biogenesis protein FimT
MHERSRVPYTNELTEVCVMERQKGLTLIELMIGVGLAGLLLSMAVPALNLFVQNGRQTAAVNEFVSSMHVARSTAVTTNARVTICASRSGGACDGAAWADGWIVFEDPDSDQAVDAGETIVATAEGSDDVTIASAEFPAFLTFRPNGRVANAGLNGSAGAFTVCDQRGAEKAKVMLIDLSGRPRQSKTMADGSLPGCA